MKNKKYRVFLQYRSGSSATIAATKPAFNVWAIIGTPAKRHMNTDTCTDKRLNEHQAEVYDSDVFGSKWKDLFDTKRQKNANRKKRRNVSDIVAGKPTRESPFKSNSVSYKEQSASTLKKLNVKRMHARTPSSE